MKALVSLLMLSPCVLSLMSQPASASSAPHCLELTGGARISDLPSGPPTAVKPVNRENWDQWAVVGTHLERDRCVDSLAQELVLHRGELFWAFYSTQDSCDGGNSYGVVYTLDLQQARFGIFDGDLVCL